MPSPRSVSALATALGGLAIVLWGTNIRVSRHLTEQLGTFSTAAIVFLSAGLLGCLLLVSPAYRRDLRQLPLKYLLVCGTLMVLNNLFIYLALGYAHSRAAVVGVIIANYLWPGLTLLLAIPLLGQRVRPLTLIAGLLASTGGVILAVDGKDLSLGVLSAAATMLPVAAAGLAAVCWALYSNLARRWAGDAPATGMPLFLLATGVSLAIVRSFVHETSQLKPTIVLELVFLILFPTLLAYVLWDHAFRRGNPTLLATTSYFIPVLAMLTGSWVLRLAALLAWRQAGSEQYR